MTIALVHPEEVESRVARLLGRLLLLDREQIRPASLLIDELDVDSLAFIELNFAIEEEFGVDFPDVKATEEMRTLCLPEALEKLEAMPGGATLFEFVKEEAVRRMLRGTVTVGELARSLEVPIPSTLSPELAVAHMQVGRLQMLGVQLGNLSARVLTSRVDQALDETTPRELFAPEIRERLFRTLTAGTLAQAIGGSLPAGLEASQPIDTLRLLQLFRFLTFGTLVRYVEYLVAHAGNGKGDAAHR